MRPRSDTADTRHDTRHFLNRSALAELFEAAQLRGLKVGVGHVAEHVLELAGLLADGDQISAQDLELDSSHLNQPSPNLENHLLKDSDHGGQDKPNTLGHSAKPDPESGQNGTEIASNRSETAQDIESIEREHILKILAEVNGNRTKAVEILGISARALRYKLKSYKDAGFLVE